jgi:hypothetical protein
LYDKNNLKYQIISKFLDRKGIPYKIEPILNNKAVRMKKLLIFIILVLISPMFGCDDSADKNEINPLTLLLLLGNNTLTVNVTYTGPTYTPAVAGGGNPAGTGKVYVYLYQSLGLNTRSPMRVYEGSSTGAVTNATPQAITLTGIWQGAYYMLVFWDYKGGSNPDNQQDRYILYNSTGGTKCTANAAAVNIPAVATVNITFNDTDQLVNPGGGGGSGPLFITTGCP